MLNYSTGGGFDLQLDVECHVACKSYIKQLVSVSDWKIIVVLHTTFCTHTVKAGADKRVCICIVYLSSLSLSFNPSVFTHTYSISLSFSLSLSLLSLSLSASLSISLSLSQSNLPPFPLPSISSLTITPPLSLSVKHTSHTHIKMTVLCTLSGYGGVSLPQWPSSWEVEHFLIENSACN